MMSDQSECFWDCVAITDGLSKVVCPLFKLLQKGIWFEWSEECEKAFFQLKKLFVMPLILAYPDFNKPFLLHIDASGEWV